MKRLARVAIWTLVGLAAAAGAATVTGLTMANRKAERNIDIEVAPVAWRDDAEALSRGKYLYESRGCMECHGADGRGRVVLNDASAGLYVRASNITAGNPAIADYTERDWVRAVRHGVAPSGRPLMIMPSEDYHQLSDPDLAALIGYIRSLQPLPGGPADIQLPTMVRLMYGFGMIQDAAAKIDHSRPPAAPMSPAPTAVYGAYVANACIGCHGATLSGGKIPGAPPDWPPAADLTPGGAMSHYGSPEGFIAMMRTGKRPDGTAVSKVMPFESLSRMSETDLMALYLHLKSLPVVQASR